jgi:hypothetical protein
MAGGTTAATGIGSRMRSGTTGTIHASPRKGKGVTHMSGTICHLCLGPLISPVVRPWAVGENPEAVNWLKIPIAPAPISAFVYRVRVPPWRCGVRIVSACALPPAGCNSYPEGTGRDDQAGWYPDVADRGHPQRRRALSASQTSSGTADATRVNSARPHCAVSARFSTFRCAFRPETAD